MPCWLILSLVLGVLLSALVSCTPVKGYSGVERPQEQIALVSVDTDNINGATVDGVVFGSSGVSLLPGQYTFQVSASHGAPPYQCRPYTVIDTYGFDRCQREREAEIRKDKGKDKKRPRECLLSVYTKHRKSCLRDYHDSACEVTLALAAGKEYEIDVPPGITGPPSVVAYAVSGNFLSKDRERVPFTGACRFVGTRTEQEDYEAW
jgi:hypothetical protein